MKALNEKKLKNPIRSIYNFRDPNPGKATSTVTKTGGTDTTNTTVTMTTTTHRNTGFSN